MFEVKRILLSLLLLATLHGFADPVTIPDEIKDGGRVWIDFNSEELVQTLPGATLNDAAELAGTILETYLRPNVESGCATPRDIALLNFCYQAFELQVQKCRMAFEQEMGRSELAEKSDAIFYDSDVEKLQARSIQDRLSDLPFRLDGESQSFCKLYSKDAALLFCDANKIHDVLWAARNKDKVEVLALDPKEYGDYPQLHWMCGWVSGVGIGVGCLGGISVVFGGLVLAKCLTAAGGAALIPGAGWVVAGGLVCVAGGIALCCYDEYGKREWLKAVVQKDKQIEVYIDRVGNRKSYLDEVIENPEGLYQRSYLGLVRITMLIDSWKRNGWRGLGRLSSKTLKRFDDAAVDVRDRAKNELNRIEDACINYPLMVDLMEASSICLYLNYLDVKNISRTTKEKDKIRQTYLENAKTVADVCSRLSKYSTGRVANSHITAYDGFFEQCYATNRVGLIKAQTKKEFDEYLKNNKAMFADEDVDLVRKGFIKRSTGHEYDTLVKDSNFLEGNSLLREIVNAKIGVEKVEEWQREAKGRVQDLWLYPSWSKEVSSAILPEGTEEIANVISEFSPLSPRASRVRVLFDAVVAEDSELVGLASLKEVFDSADTIDEVKRAIIKEINRRKLGDLKKEIEGNHGRVEDMVGRWIDAAVLDGTSDKLGCSKLSVRDVAARMKSEILPMWRKIELCERKPWWKFW